MLIAAKLFSQVPLRKKCTHSELLWSVFSRIRTEYGDIQTLRIQSEFGKLLRTRITSSTVTFSSVYAFMFFYFLSTMCFFIQSIQVLSQKGLEDLKNSWKFVRPKTTAEV